MALALASTLSLITCHLNMMVESESTVFVIDDDPSVRKSLSRLLRSIGYAVETFSSTEEFLTREFFNAVGCIILDVQMPGRSGMDLQIELSKTQYSMPIVFITGHGDIPMGVEAIKRGAVHFLTKPFDDKKLMAAVKEAIEKDRKAKTEQSEVRGIRGRIGLLTPREYEILRYVISGILNKQIAFRLNIAEKTVKIHRGRVMEKLRVDSVAELVRLAQKTGIEPLKE